MKKRPHIPISVKIETAFQQIVDRAGEGKIEDFSVGRNGQQTLKAMLDYLGITNPRLDHNPALALREYNPRTGKWNPDANDPNYLVYRNKDDHDLKTYVRGDGARRPDISEIVHQRKVARAIQEHAEAMKDKRRARKRSKKKGPKIQSRGFAKVKRKMQSRNTFASNKKPAGSGERAGWNGRSR